MNICYPCPNPPCRHFKCNLLTFYLLVRSMCPKLTRSARLARRRTRRTQKNLRCNRLNIPASIFCTLVEAAHHQFWKPVSFCRVEGVQVRTCPHFLTFRPILFTPCCDDPLKDLIVPVRGNVVHIQNRPDLAFLVLLCLFAPLHADADDRAAAQPFDSFSKNTCHPNKTYAAPTLDDAPNARGR